MGKFQTNLGQRYVRLTSKSTSQEKKRCLADIFYAICLISKSKQDVSKAV